MIGKSFKNLRNAIIVLFLIILTGTSGFMFIEGWNFPDSLYMTIITITTTGFEEVHQLSTEGENIYTYFTDGELWYGYLYRQHGSSDFN